MLRRIALIFSLFVVGCSSSTGGTIVDGGTDGTTDGPSFDVFPDACTDCIAAQLTWGWTGGLTAYDDSSGLAPCRTYTHSRVRHDVDVGGPQTCTTDVATCGATDVVGLSQIEGALAQPDVVAAFAAAPVLYGKDTRPVDGAVFDITYGGKTVSVGVDCDETGPCTPVPPGVKALQSVLQTLDTQELAKGPCVTVFGPPGGV